MRSRSAWIAALAATGALAAAPMAMAGIPFSAKGETLLAPCAAAGDGAHGQAKWDGPKFEIRFVIPDFANKSVDVEVHYAPSGRPEINQEVSLDAKGEGRLKVEPAPGVGPREIEVEADGSAIVLLTSDAHACPAAV